MPSFPYLYDDINIKKLSRAWISDYISQNSRGCITYIHALYSCFLLHNSQVFHIPINIARLVHNYISVLQKKSNSGSPTGPTQAVGWVAHFNRILGALSIKIILRHLKKFMCTWCIPYLHIFTARPYVHMVHPISAYFHCSSICAHGASHICIFSLLVHMCTWCIPYLHIFTARPYVHMVHPISAYFHCSSICAHGASHICIFSLLVHMCTWCIPYLHIFTARPQNHLVWGSGLPKEFMVRVWRPHFKSTVIYSWHRMVLKEYCHGSVPNCSCGISTVNTLEIPQSCKCAINISTADVLEISLFHTQPLLFSL